MDLRNTQLKDTYGNLVTTGTTAGSPTTGGLQNGQGTLLTSVGIGTDSPNALLELSGRSDTGDITMRFADKDGGVLTGQDHSNIEYFATDGSAVSAEVKTIYADVVGGLDYTISTRAGGGSLAERLRIRSTGDISFRDGSASEAFYWDASAGSLGIGTTSPTEKLQIVDSANDVHVRIGSGNAGINPTLRFHGKNTADTTNVYADIRINPDNQTLGFSGTGTSGGSIEQDALVIDSSGQVGIGTDNPATRLDIQGVGGATTSPSVTATTGTSYIGWKSVNTGGSFWTAIDNSTGSSFSTNTAYARVLWSNGAYPMVFSTNSTERMRIDSSGNVGIGCSPSAKLDVDSGSTQTVSVFKASSTSTATNNGGALIGIRNTNDTDGNMEGLFFQNSNGNSTSGIIGYNVNHSTNEGLMTFGVRNSSGTFGEKMRINSSGNVLVGKTTSSIASEGVELFPNDRSAFTRDSGYSILVNRLTSDGDLINFRKDGTTVGSIGTEGGDMAIGNGDAGLQFIDGTQSIRPFNLTTNARIDAQVDLGMSTTRFKDLYLSGSVYLGGTTSSNALDDYEEGTWSPVYAPQTGSFATMTMDVASATYTKIGRQVTVSAFFRTDNVDITGGSGDLRIGGLPFTVGEFSALIVGYVRSWGTAPDGGYPNPTTTQINLQKSSVGANSSVSDLTTGLTANQNQIMITATYFV
jgi:hypothetical protein